MAAWQRQATLFTRSLGSGRILNAARMKNVAHIPSWLQFFTTQKPSNNNERGGQVLASPPDYPSNQIGNVLSCDRSRFLIRTWRGLAFAEWLPISIVLHEFIYHLHELLTAMATRADGVGLGTLRQQTCALWWLAKKNLCPFVVDRCHSHSQFG